MLQTEEGTHGLMCSGGTVHISADIENKGDHAGAEVVQLYLHDVIGTVVTPVKELRGFEKVQLEPGQTKTVRFTIAPEQMALLDRHLEWVVEAGTFEVLVGHSSRDIRLKGVFEVVGH